jgi:DNA-binding transcriptional LysR family regulator
MAMDPHLLRTFTAVARLGSFSGAARDLGYTQSAVSQQVAALEADLGVPLLTRRPVAPTEAGARLLEHARPLLLRLAAARADVQRMAGAPPTLLALATSPLALPRAAAALSELRRSMPRLDLTVRVVGREDVAAEVAAGDADVGLVDGIAAPSDPLQLPDVGPLSVVGVGEELLVVALPLGHPLARRNAIALATLVDARWLDAPDVSAPLPRLRAALGTDGFRASLRYQATDLDGLLALVAAGHGLALLPGSAARAGGLTGVPLSTPRLVHRTELLHTDGAGDAVAALRSALAAGG